MKKIAALDSLRGIMAVNVLFYHLYLLDNSEFNMYTPKNFYLAGHEAVIFFFVLSGFVLDGTLIKPEFSYPSYIVKRLCRIMPTYYLTMLIAIIFYLSIKPQPLIALSSWFNGQMPSIPFISNELILKTLFLAPSNKLNGVVWSLSYELLISIFYLPFLIYILKKIPRYIEILLFIVIVIFIYYPPQHFIIAGFYFTIFFLFGVLLNIHQNATKKIIWFMPILIALYYNKFWLSHFLIYNESIRDLMTGVGSTGLICVVKNSNVISKLLSNKFCLFFGNISYPLYLLHVPLIYILIYRFYPYINLIYIKLITLICVSILSWVMHIYIESPSIKSGRVFANITKTRKE